MPTSIKLEPHDSVALVRLQNGVTNAIGPPLVDALAETLCTVEADYRGLLLCGGKKFFSIGLDLPALLALDRPAMTAFWQRFEQTVLALYTLPLPTAAAIGGHATAGGLILALACDYRFAAAGRKALGLNEVKIGLGVPYLAHLMLKEILGYRIARTLELEGEFSQPEDAHEIGLIDAIEPSAELETQALAKVSTLAALPASGFRFNKQNRTLAVTRRFAKERKQRLQAILAAWFAPQAQALLHKAAEKF
jgi:enoyl-CoA hydratase/carnithine racemase